MLLRLVSSTILHIIGLSLVSRLWEYAASGPKPHHFPLYIGGPSVAHPYEEWSDKQQIPDSQPAPSRLGSWNGFGGGVYNNRWASSDATVDSANIDSLERVCAKFYNPGVSAPPLVQDGIAYYATWSGLLVALDYRSCRTVWQLNVTRIVRKFKPLDPQQEVVVSPVARTTPVSDGDVLYFGTQAHALVVAVDKAKGKVIDVLQLSDHPFAIITSSPTFYKGRLFVGVSSLEEDAAVEFPDYPCCTFAGMITSVALKHGRLRLLWAQSTIPPGIGFSGASVWGGQPSIDPIRDQVFVASGNTYQLPQEFEDCQKATANITVVKNGLTQDACLPRHVLQDSVLALDIETGRLNWFRQLGILDAWNLACIDGLLGPPTGSLSCPDVAGPDADFGMAPTFVLGSQNTPHNLDIVVVGQKSGNLYALSAASGMTQWVTVTSPGGLEGGLIWGVAVDDRAVYYTAVNSNGVNYTLPGGDNKTVISGPAFGAANLKDGTVLWQIPTPRNTSAIEGPSVVNDIVLTGVIGNSTGGFNEPTGPGALLAIDKRTGKILREVGLDSIFRGAAAVVHDYVFFGTGYSGIHAATPGSFQVWKVKGTKTVVDDGRDEL